MTTVRRHPPRAAPLLPEERRRNIASRVEREGRATVGDLAHAYQVSEVTIRNDLNALAREGILTRSHGGALPALTTSRTDTPLTVKETQHQAEKQRLGAAAATRIVDGETIILDSGSTTAEIARCIRQQHWHSLTVITNAVHIALELADASGVRVMMLGGMLRPLSRSLAGRYAEQTLGKLSADRLFLGVDGLDIQVGVTTPDPEEAALNALMVRVSRETIAVLDSSKFGQRSLSVIVPVAQLHTIITDAGAPPDAVNALREHGVRVVIA